MKKDLAVVLVSGGMDSCVTAAIAHREYLVAFLHVSYGQRTELREFRAFNAIADFYNVNQRLSVSLEYLKQIGGSSLTDENIPLPDAGKECRTPHAALRVPSTYVPFRNAHLLSVATSWAEVIGARKIFIGAVEEDSSGYPDCREVFYQAFNKTIEQGTKPETVIEVITPVIHMKKAGIVHKGLELGAPLHLSWSCYQNSEQACGKCESCTLRLKAFREAEVEDPIPYEA